MKTLSNGAKAIHFIVIILLIIGFVGTLGPYTLPTSWYTWIIHTFYGMEYSEIAIPTLEENWVQSMIHRLGAAVWLFIGLLQFNTKLRAKKPKLHRNLGKLFLVLCYVVGIGGFIMSITVGFAEVTGEGTVIAFYGIFIMWFASKAWQTAVQKNFKDHNMWVIRTYAIGLAVLMMRVWFLSYQLIFPEVSATVHFNTTSWAGLIVNLVLAEAYIIETVPGKKKKKKKVVTAKA